MPSALKERILEDAKAAMRARDKPRLAALRLIQAAIKQDEVDSRSLMDDSGILALLGKMAKRLNESIAIYRQAGRNDLVDKELAELAVIEGFLPEKLPFEQIERHVDAAIAETAASGMKDMGRVMGLLKARLQGQADMGQVSRMIKDRLGRG